MRRWQIVILIVLGIFFSGYLQQKNISKPIDLESFSSKEGRFTLLMPGTPKLETRVVNTAKGEVTAYMYIVKLDDRVYMVSYSDYPDDAIHELTPEQILDNGRDGMIANVFGELISETIISLDGYPGRQLNIGVGNSGIRAKIFLVKNRMYGVMVSGPNDKMYLEPAGDVLDSFRLLE